MKKALLVAAVTAVSAFTAMADWGTNVSDQIAMFPTGTISYGLDVQPTPEGGAWGVIYHPNLKNAEGETDIKNVIYEYRVQCWDKNGNALFPEEGLLVSDFNNKSYTVVNNYLSVDAEGNAILAVMDCRNSNSQYSSYTAYKISQKGEMLWGEEGMPISDPLSPQLFSAMITGVPMEDGSVMFSWIGSNDAEGGTNVYLQRLDKNGKTCWDEKKVALLDDECSNPYLVYSGDNTCILVYSRTPSQIIYARKIDFEGENVWGKDTRVYRGGWGSIPIHTLISVVPSGDGGALISWNDDRNNTNIEDPYLFYLKPDGKIGFQSASEEGDVKLGYANSRSFNVKAIPAADGSAFYAAWRETSPAQNTQGLRVQKLNKTGELLWDENGLSIDPMTEKSVGYITLQSADKDKVMVFYMRYYNYFNQVGYATLLDSEGRFVWQDSGMKQITPENHKSANLTSMPIPGNESWLYYWSDAPGEESETDDTTFRMGKIYISGNIGEDKSLVYSPIIDSRNVRFDGTNLYAEGKVAFVYSPSGVLIKKVVLNDGIANLGLSKGLYLISVDGRKTVKVSVGK